MDNYDKVLNSLSVALDSLVEAKETIGDVSQEKLLILNSIINKTQEAIHRWKFRHGKV